MNRGVLQSSPVQQMMATGNPNWWNINTMRPPIAHHHRHHQQPPNLSSPFLAPPNTNLYPQFLPNTTTNFDNQEHLPESWSQLLLGGLVGADHEELIQKGNMMSHIFQVKKLENWEEQMLCNQAPNINNASVAAAAADIVKQEQQSSARNNSNYQVYGHGSCEQDQFHDAVVAKSAPLHANNWSQNQIMASSSSSSPKSCVTSFSSNMLDFSSKSQHDHQAARNQVAPPDRSSECNSTATGGALKKARINQASNSTPTTFKVRKEKLGDRITALHQLVSPFGKTDTASVLLEAIGYIRFLQSQIEALSLPYLGSGSGNMRQQQSVHGERNCMFPEDPGQLLNDNCMKRKGAPDQQGSMEEAKKDLRSRGLCLVPVSCTLQVGSDNGADYWAPAALGGGFR